MKDLMIIMTEYKMQCYECKEEFIINTDKVLGSDSYYKYTSDPLSKHYGHYVGLNKSISPLLKVAIYIRQYINK